MKFNLSKEESRKLEGLLSVIREAEEADGCLNVYLNDSHVGEQAFLKRKLDGGLAFPEAFKALVSEKFHPAERDILEGYFQKGYIAAPKKLNPEEYGNDPYYLFLSKLGIPERKGLFSQISYAPYEVFQYDEKGFIDENNLVDCTLLGYFEKELSFPAILGEDNRVWMSLVPHEINSMRQAIYQVHGKVLTYGLGLGYFAFMAARKREVSEVTVIELEKETVSFYKKSILPRIPFKDKIKTICQDAIEFNEQRGDMPSYDYCFADLWHDVEDGLDPYLLLRQNEGIARKHLYWEEKDLLIYFRRHLCELISLELEGAPEEAFEDDEEESFSDLLINALHRHFRDYEAKSYEEIIDLLSLESLRKLTKKLDLS